MKKKRILCGLACAVLMTSCGIMPAEEQLPSAPIAKEVQEIEHVMTVVHKGDIVVEENIRCTYKPARSESLAFEVGGEYIEKIYVQAGDSVKKGDLIAELDMGDLNEQLENQQYALETLQMNKKHIEQQRDLAIRRCNLQIQQIKEQLNDLTTASQTAASAAVIEESSSIPEESSEESGSDSEIESSMPESSEDTESLVSEGDSSSGESSDPSEESDSSQPIVTPEESDSSQPIVTPEESDSSQPIVTPEESDSSQPIVTPEESDSSQPEDPEEPTEPETPEEPEIDIEAVKEQLNQTLKEYNQNLTSVTNQYAQRLRSVNDSIYIQGKRIEEIEKMILERQVYANMDGSITFLRSYEEGAVSVEDETVVIIADIESSVFFITGEDAAAFEIGETVNIEYDKELHEAIVIEPKQLGLPTSEDGEAVSYLQLVQPDPSLDEGTKGTVTVVVESREDVLYVKSSTIKTMQGTNIVYYLNEEGLKSMKEVEIGLDNGDIVEIVSGLVEGEEIIDE